MKWIKYQIMQCVVGEEPILVNKQIGYSDANIVIAETEAYNGYEIFDDGKPEPETGKIPTKLSELENDTGFSREDTAASQFVEQFAIGDTANDISNAYDWATANKPSAFNARQRGCCFGNGYYVVAGTSGQMVYSKDCVTWTMVPSFTSEVITALTYGNGRFIAVDSGGNIFSAPTPIDTWESGLDAGGVINAVRYINNRFVAVGEEGFIAYSKDGKEWNVIHAFEGGEIYFTDCTWGNGYFIAVGKAGAVWRSVTLYDWEDCTITDFGGDIRTSRFVAGGFVVGGQAGKIYYSSDGKTWHIATNNTSLTISYIRDFSYAEGRIYAFSYSSGGKGEIWLSKDNGATWTVALTTSTRLWCSAYGNGRFITSGDSGAIYVLDLGIEWLDVEPQSGVSIWHRYVTTLSTGDQVISESYKIKYDHDVAAHNQSAGTITAGTFAGQVVANAAGQSSGVSLLRNSKVVLAEENPTVEGEIVWVCK